MSAEEAMKDGARSSTNAINHALGLADHFRTSKEGMLKAYNHERGRRWWGDPRLAQELHSALDRYHDWAKERWTYGPNSVFYRSTLADFVAREHAALDEHVRRPGIDHISKRFPFAWLVIGLVLGAAMSEVRPHIGPTFSALKASLGHR